MVKINVQIIGELTEAKYEAMKVKLSEIVTNSGLKIIVRATHEIE